jgi:hypothetical protein
MIYNDSLVDKILVYSARKIRENPKRHTQYYLGQFFMEPSDYYDAPIGKVLHFIQGVGLIRG